MERHQNETNSVQFDDYVNKRFILHSRLNQLQVFVISKGFASLTIKKLNLEITTICKEQYNLSVALCQVGYKYDATVSLKEDQFHFLMFMKWLNISQKNYAYSINLHLHYQQKNTFVYYITINRTLRYNIAAYNECQCLLLFQLVYDVKLMSSVLTVPRLSSFVGTALLAYNLCQHGCRKTKQCREQRQCLYTVVVTCFISWKEAYHVCKRHAGYLTVINDKMKEHQLIDLNKYIYQSSIVFIGLVKTKVYIYI